MASRLLELLLGSELGRVSALPLPLWVFEVCSNEPRVMVDDGVLVTYAVGSTGRETSVTNTADLLVAL